MPHTVSVRVVRPGFDNGLTDEQKSHPSETELDEYPFDYVVENVDLASMAKSADILVEDFEKDKEVV